MGKESILVVDDEEDILELVRFHLGREGYDVLCAETGEDAWRIVKEMPIDLLLLDLMLPGIDGLELTRRLKNDPKTAKIPVLMLSAKGEEVDVVTGLEMGADDYVTKPFSPRVLLARVRAVFRRRTVPIIPDDEMIHIHGLMIDRGRRSLYIDNQPVDLTYTEFQVLALLAARPGWVFTRTQIVDAVRGVDYPVTDRSVDVQIVGLRKKLGDYGHLIETVRGVGYRFKERP
ncbi:MAG: response regulator transcription factor [Desulfatitalea sp.]|nr:response regulator transcription factor [Desulfatitalea sp.]NNK01008.1 response regulator transcription factor [Desulfatitalea sp.]